ncbi:MAG: exo-alpha-sialidase [Verrucomicrobiales bacterium]|nr:exo-alpha-sialidase [Verrucomicrobiales bacterium]
MKYTLLLFLLALQVSAQDKTLLDLSLEPPQINTQPGPEYADAVRPGNMIIGMDRTPKGRIWAAWVGNGDSPNGFFMLATSDDDGKSWSHPRVVIDPQDGELNGVRYTRRALVGNLWTDPLGRLWCFFDQSLGYFDGRCGDWFIRCDDPDAAEPKWTAPVRFADGCTLNKPTVLSNGDWILPVSLWTRDRIGGPGTDKEAHKDLDIIRMANVFASTDQGKTWTRRGGVAFPRTDFDEHTIVERKDGSLWMLALLGRHQREHLRRPRSHLEPTPAQHHSKRQRPLLHPPTRQRQTLAHQERPAQCPPAQPHQLEGLPLRQRWSDLGQRIAHRRPRAGLVSRWISVPRWPHPPPL